MNTVDLTLLNYYQKDCNNMTMHTTTAGTITVRSTSYRYYGVSLIQKGIEKSLGKKWKKVSGLCPIGVTTIVRKELLHLLNEVDKVRQQKPERASRIKIRPELYRTFDEKTFFID